MADKKLRRHLLECFEELLGIVLCSPPRWSQHDDQPTVWREKTLTLGQTLQSGQSLPSISLLDTDVDVILLRTDVFTASKRVSLVCKGVC